MVSSRRYHSRSALNNCRLRSISGLWGSVDGFADAFVNVILRRLTAPTRCWLYKFNVHFCRPFPYPGGGPGSPRRGQPSTPTHNKDSGPTWCGGNGVLVAWLAAPRRSAINCQVPVAVIDGTPGACGECTSTVNGPAPRFRLEPVYPSNLVERPCATPSSTTETDLYADLPESVLFCSSGLLMILLPLFDLPTDLINRDCRLPIFSTVVLPVSMSLAGALLTTPL